MTQIYVLLLIDAYADASALEFVGPFDDAAAASGWGEACDQDVIIDWQIVRLDLSKIEVLAAARAAVTFHRNEDAAD